MNRKKLTSLECFLKGTVGASVEFATSFFRLPTYNRLHKNRELYFYKLLDRAHPEKYDLPTEPVCYGLVTGWVLAIIADSGAAGYVIHSAINGDYKPLIASGIALGVGNAVSAVHEIRRRKKAG